MNHQQYIEALARQGLRIASENESGWTDRYYDETRGETVKTWITDSPTPERIAAIASEVGCTVEQVQGIIDFEAGEKQRDADSLEWKTRTFNIWIPDALGPRQGYMIVATIPDAKGKSAKEYDLWRVGSPDEVGKVTLVRRWSGGGMCRIHRRDGTTKDVRYGKRERVPSSEGGKSREAKERWI